MTIAHLSDIHFGRIAHEHIVEDLMRDIATHEVDLVAVSGDLTQRALPREFEAAAAMLDAFETPVLVVPGNHDVYPWWNPIRRIRHPLRRYRRYITDEMTPKYEQEGVAVLGVNSAHGWTIKGGRLGDEALQTIQTYFSARAGHFNGLVLHHHLTKLRNLLRGHDIVWHAQRVLEIAVTSGVDLILCGHLHTSHIEPIEVVPGERRLIIASAGTATSNRGRGSDRSANVYSIVTVDDAKVTVQERCYEPALRSFAARATTQFERGATAAPQNTDAREA